MNKPNDKYSYMIFGIFKLYCKCYKREIWNKVVRFF